MIENTTIQIKKEIRDMIREHCKTTKQSISGFIELRTLEYIKKHDKLKSGERLRVE